MEDLKRHLLCIDAATGEPIWEKRVDAILPEDPFAGPGVPAHGYSSHTPTSDGERVYVFFGKTGALAFDMEGNQLWHERVGSESDPQAWGSSSSPILHKNLLIITASAESQALVALDKETGKEKWRAEAAGLDNVFGTPAIVNLSPDRADLVIGVPNEFWGIDPDSGEFRWFAEAIKSDSFMSSVVIQDEMIYAVEGRNGGSIAVRAGGDGDVSKSHRMWSGQEVGRFGSPIVYGERMYFISNGVVHCVNVKTGEKIFKSRLEGGPPEDQPSGPGGGIRGPMDYASPIIADEKLYYVTGTGVTHVVKLGDEFEQLAANRVTDGEESFGATPAASNGRLYLRSDKHLYCVDAE
jgi:hypothetical protein